MGRAELWGVWQIEEAAGVSSLSLRVCVKWAGQEGRGVGNSGYLVQLGCPLLFFSFLTSHSRLLSSPIPLPLLMHTISTYFLRFQPHSETAVAFDAVADVDLVRQMHS